MSSAVLIIAEGGVRAVHFRLSSLQRGREGGGDVTAVPNSAISPLAHDFQHRHELQIVQ